MRNKISNLPIILDRKASVYEGVGDGDTDCFDLEWGDNVILTSDGSSVEYWNGICIDCRRPPLSTIQIELNISTAEFKERTLGEDTYVELILVGGNKVIISITTAHDVIYYGVHTI